MTGPLVRSHAANLVVLLRTALVFLIISLFAAPSHATRTAALTLLAVAAPLDWLDGFIARRLGTVSRMGSLLDTLGDRITENLLLVYFSWERLVPLYLPIVFVARSFASDFIRHLNAMNGHSTFSVNQSRLGRLIVASRASRAIYLILKMAVFFLAGAALLLEVSPESSAALEAAKAALVWGSGTLVFFNLLRFCLLISDSREILEKEVIRNGAPEQA